MTQPYVSDDTPIQLAEELERMADQVEEFEPLDAAKLRVAALILRSKSHSYMVWNLDDLPVDDEAGR